MDLLGEKKVVSQGRVCSLPRETTHGSHHSSTVDISPSDFTFAQSLKDIILL